MSLIKNDNISFMGGNIRIWLLLVFCSLQVHLHAQVNVVNSNNANFLAKKLIGPGVDISNASILCNANQSGFFVSPSSLLGMDSGIVLTTGLAATNSPFNGVNGPQINFANQNQGTGGDIDLTALAGISTYDRCVLEFDFKGDGDTIFFEYRFGSEEYPSFNCTNYNDVFGFFISGPGIVGSQNLALIPGTTIPVAINSVNNGVVVAGGNISYCTSMGAGSPFTSLYVDNTGGPDMTYDGFTVMFKAKSYIQACSTYHIKLAIADGFDQIFDSGVFLKAGSFKTNSYHLTMSTDSMSTYPPYAFEGCDSIILKIKRDNFQTGLTQDTVTLLVQGTATNGIDYPLVASSYIFSASLSDTIKTLYVDPFNDLITEGTETIKFYLKNKCNFIIDSVIVAIKDPKKFTLYNADTNICIGQQVQINGVYDNGLVFSWSPTTGVSNPNIINPILSPTVTTSYTLTATYGNCDPVKDTVKVTVQPLPSISLTSTNVTCTGFNNGTITATGTVGSNPLTFSIMPGSTILTGSPSTFTNLAPGTYTVTISSGIGCTKTAVKVITEPNAMSWGPTSVVNIGCNAGNVGQLSATASGGTGMINYTLTPGNTTNSSGTFTGIGPGLYIVTAKDANNCTITTSLTVTQATSLTWFLVTPTNILCNGQSTGSIFTSATGGSGIVTYTMQPGGVSNTTGNFTSLSSGSYTVTAIDGTGCSASTVVSLTQPATSISIGNPTVTNVLCNGTSSGAVSVTANGGTGQLVYLLNPPGSSNTAGTFTGKPAGNYTITVTDANGCTKTTTFVITQPPAINIVSNNAFPTCIPGNNGTISITASGGVPNYLYKINGGSYQSSPNFTGLGSANYTITVKDANNCTSTVVIPLQIANQVTLINSSLPLTCTTAVTTINVTAVGGSAPFTYTLMPNNISNGTGQFPGVDSGTYVVTVVDANGCSNSIQVVLLIPPELTWANFSTTNIACSGAGTGNVAAIANGGVSPYTYSINPPGTTNTSGIFNSLTQGFYTVLAVDANGCSKSSVVHIIISPPLSIGPPSINPVTCFGTNTATVQINPIGGSFPMVYTLNPGSITNITGNFTNLGAGTYTVSVLDAGNCSNTGSFTITQPSVLTLNNVTTTPPSCVPGSDGTITVNASGGTPNYTYSSGGAFQPSNVLTGLNIGTYTVTVKDIHACTSTTVVTLINPTAPAFNSLIPGSALCNGTSTGSLSVTINSGTNPMSYSLTPLGITNANGQFNNIPANTYTITVTDALNCVITTTANILQPSPVVWTSVASTNVVCNNTPTGTISVAASGGVGGMSYQAMPGNLTSSTGNFTSLVNATYTVTALDANNCSITTIINITQPSALFWNGLVASNATCYNLPTASIQAPAVGGSGLISYTLMPGSNTNTTGSYPSVMSGSYTVTATDGNGCTITTAFNLTQPASYPSISTTNTIPTCTPGNDAIITVTMSGGTPGYLYSLNGLPNQTSNIFTGIGIATYSITVADMNGCTVTTLVPVVNTNAPSISSVNATNVLCFGGNTGSIVTNITGGFGTLNVNLQPSNTNNSTGIFNNLLANNYTISVSDANNCIATTNVIITQPPMLMWDSVDNRDVACYGGGNGVVTSSASGGSGTIVYHLLPSNVSNYTGIFFGLGVGQYTLTATDNNGCVVTAVFQINQPPPITWVNVSNTPVSCAPNTDGSISASATGGNGQFDYKLLPGNIINTTGNFNNLGVGTYTVIASDFLNCTLSTVIQILPGPPVVVTGMATTLASCVPGCDGSVVISATGGNGFYTYSNNGSAFQLGNIFSSLCAGAYTVQVKDGNNCSGTGIFTIATANGPSALTSTPTSVSCFGGSNGGLQIGIIGGANPVNYILNPGNVSNTTGLFTGLSAAAYTIMATDANGCSISTIAQISQPAQYQINNSTSSPVSCYSGSNGSLSVSVSGGVGSSTFTLLPNNITNGSGQFNALIAGVYTVNAVDANGCTTSSVVSVNQPTVLLFSSANTTPISCNGGADGLITTLTTGGTGTITYAIQPGAISNTTGIFTNLGLNTYTVTATDANGCSISTTLIITQPSPLQITGITNTIPTCIPGGDASMTITASGATPPYQYNINGGVFQFGNTINNLSIGSYTVMVKDANNCTITSVVLITSPNAPIVSSINTTTATCLPGCDATATVTSTNGSGVHTYSLNGGPYQASNVFSNLCVNTYTVVVKDVNGCTGSGIFSIVNPLPPVVFNIQSTIASCNPGCDGSLTMFTIGGTGTHLYAINGGSFQSGNLFSNLCAGLYTLTVKDAAGCTATNLASVNSAVGPVLTSVTKTNVLCYGGNNGTLSLNVNGGNLPINFTLNPGNVNNTSGAFSNLSAGVYTITGVDAYGCSLSTIVTINQPPSLQITNVTAIPPSCSGNTNGSITMPVTGGFGALNYAIQPSGVYIFPSTFNGLAGNITYTLTVTDANGCSISSSIFLSDPSPLVINSLIADSVTCNGFANATLVANGSGGTGSLTYTLLPNNWSTANGLYNNLSGGTYTVVLTDANACSISSSIFVFEPTPIAIVTATATNITCNGWLNGSISVTASGGMPSLSYTLLPNNATNSSGSFTNLGPNTYTVQIKDANNCTLNTALMVQEPTSLLFSSVTVNQVQCTGLGNGQVNAQASGGTGLITYSVSPGNWSNTSGLFLGLGVNTYTITATDANGCTTVSTFTITQPPPLDLILDSIHNITCHFGNDGFIGGHAIGGTLNYTYTLKPNNVNNGIGQFTGLTANAYTLLVTDANGCKDSISPILLVEPPLIVFTQVNHQDITCYLDSSGAIMVTAAGGTGGLTYTVSPMVGNQVSPGNFQNLAAGTYTVTVKDSKNCTVTTLVTIQQNLQIQANVTYTEPICHGDQNGSIEIMATGGTPPLVYSINGTAFSSTNLFTNLGAGTYTIAIKDTKNCIADTLLVLTEPDRVGAMVSITDAICEPDNDGRVQVIGTGGRGDYVYYLKPGVNINKTGLFQNLHSGIYTLTVKDSSNCYFDTVITLLPPSNFMSIVFDKKDVGCYGYGNDAWAKAWVTGGTPPYGYLWNDPASTTAQLVEKLRWGTYQVLITDSNGCKYADTVHIHPGICCDDVFIPTAFSPNQDGKNDRWRVVTGAGLELRQLNIYNRWGNRVWVADDITDSWDGNYKGDSADVGTYYYIFRYKCLNDGQEYTKKGDISLIR